MGKNAGKNDGKDLIALAYALASSFAEGKTADEINVLASFFMVMGDTLGLMAAKLSLCESDNAN